MMNQQVSVWQQEGDPEDVQEQMRQYIENEFTNPAGEIEIGMLLDDISSQHELNKDALNYVLVVILN